jgi:hypothetical protein
MVFVSGKPDIYSVYHGFSFPEKILWIFQKEGKHPEKIRKERQLPARRPSRILPRLLRSKKRYPQKL